MKVSNYALRSFEISDFFAVFLFNIYKLKMSLKHCKNMVTSGKTTKQHTNWYKFRDKGMMYFRGKSKKYGEFCYKIRK